MAKEITLPQVIPSIPYSFTSWWQTETVSRSEFPHPAPKVFTCSYSGPQTTIPRWGPDLTRETLPQAMGHPKHPTFLTSRVLERVGPESFSHSSNHPLWKFLVGKAAMPLVKEVMASVP
jgi:hypothetical protein